MKLFLQRGMIFLLLFWLGMAGGWEFLLAGIIFFLSLNPARYEYLFLALIFDAVFLFPPGFFAVAVLALTYAARFLARYFEAENLSSFLVRTAGLTAAGFFITLLYFLVGLKRGADAVAFSSTFLLKDVLLIMSLALFFKILEKFYARQTFAP